MWVKDKMYYSLLRKSRQRKISIVLLCVHVSVSADEALGRGGYSGGESNCVKQCVHDFPILGKPVNDKDHFSQRVFKWIFEDQAYTPVV